MFEWVLDRFDGNWYQGGGYSCQNCANLTPGLTNRVFRGGSWSNESAYVRSAIRLEMGLGPTFRNDNLGFRCARGEPPGSRWSDAPSYLTWIDVCWAPSAGNSLTWEGEAIPDNPGATQLKRWVREAVDNTWGRFTSLNFNLASDNTEEHEWMICDSPAPARTIVLSFAREDASARGRYDDRPTWMHVNAWKSERWEYHEAAIREFGRALMLYANDPPPNRIGPADLVRAQQTYGRKPAGALIGWGGRCTDVDHAQPAPGVRIIQFPCAAAENQTWRPYVLPTVGLEGLSATLQGNVRCLSVEGGVTSATQPTSVVTGVCGPNQHQRFPLHRMQWKALGDWCVTAQSATAGAGLELLPCGSGGPERWDFILSQPGRVVLSDTNLCLAAPNPEPREGDALALADCATEVEPTQAFDFTRSGMVGYGADGCVMVNGASPGALSLALACSAEQPERMFNLTGHLMSLEQCMAIDNDVSFNFAAAKVHACSPPPSDPTWFLPDPQDWDYYW
jgi:hypothetical protein